MSPTTNETAKAQGLFVGVTKEPQHLGARASRPRGKLSYE